MNVFLNPFHVLILLIGLPLFFTPTLIAGRRQAEHYWWIALANLLAGGTGAGWVVVLIWALNARPRATSTLLAH